MGTLVLKTATDQRFGGRVCRINDTAMAFVDACDRFGDAIGVESLAVVCVAIDEDDIPVWKAQLGDDVLRSFMFTDELTGEPETWSWIPV